MRDDLTPWIDPSVLDRYLAGDASASEREVVEQWISSSATARLMVDELRAEGAFDDAHLAAVSFDAGVVHAQIETHLADTRLPVAFRISHQERGSGVMAFPAGGQTVQRPRRWFTEKALRRAPLPRALWAAATALAVVGVIVASWQAGMSTMRRRVSAATVTYATANSQRANITLPDGSTVALGVASRLDIPADYAAGNRSVRLVGQALFTVVHRGHTPFSVLAGPETVRVLGTQFVVRRYATDSLTTVAVRDGKVAVRSTIVTAAQQLVTDRVGRGRLTSADLGQFSFAAGILTLDHVPLRDAIVELDRWYDADIRLGDPVLATRLVVGEYAAGSLTQLSDILAGTFDVRVVRNGRVLTLYPR